MTALITAELEGVKAGIHGAFDVVGTVIHKKAFSGIKTVFFKELLIDLNVWLEHQIV